MSSGDWIGVDLDGTLAYYDKWRGADHIGEPILPMVDRVKEFLIEGRTVKIFTARAALPEQIPAVKQWCVKHFGQELPVTNIKDQGLCLLYDDKAIGVVKNTGAILTIPADY